MSLDIKLFVEEEVECCSNCGHPTIENRTVFGANITHNLTTMADEAGIYNIVWRPEENEITKAEQLIEPLSKAIADMKTRPEFYKAFDASNGWGRYIDFVPWLEDYLQACKDYPNAKVYADR